MDHKFVVADPDTGEGNGWTHFFFEDGKDKERDCRFAFNTETQKLDHLDIRRDNKWRASTANDRADLEDSLVNANWDAMTNPDAWGLISTDDLPDWAVPDDVPTP